MNNNDKWALITTYKVLTPAEINFQFMETFINFYRKKWNVKKEILLIGIPKNLIEQDPKILKPITRRLEAVGALTESTTVKSLKLHVDNVDLARLNTIISAVNYYSSKTTDFVLYTTNHSTSEKDWNAIKEILFKICDTMLDPSYNRVINIDNDEFLFLDQERAAEEEESFHFVDFVPPRSGKLFDSTAPFRWCVQPWYCRKEYLCAEHNERDHESIDHVWCKKYRFDRKHILDPSEHMGYNHNCKACDVVDNAKNLSEALHSVNRCYHLSVLDEEHYLKGKSINFQESQTDKTHNVNLRQLIKNYNYYYSEETFRPVGEHKTPRRQTFYDDSLKKFWANK
tara:strand:- start:8839 stop:9861 length:1023 start_codon:yes stop_codon:yes gene_type:complete